MPLRLDLHVHTEASPDSLLTPATLLRVSQEQGLHGIAVTDHNCLVGALEVARQAPADLLVIVGEEVRTAQGELLGLFLQEELPVGKDPLETARAIRAQGGLVGIPHPCDSFRKVLTPEARTELLRAGLLDFLEGRNGRVLWSRDNRRAKELGQRFGLPLTAGSDAHSPREVGACTTLLPAFHGPQEFLVALAEGQLQGRPSPPWIHLLSTTARLRRAWRGHPPTGI